MEPSGSCDAAASNVTSSGAVPCEGVAVNATMGSAFTVIVLVADAVALSSSVTVSVAVYVPGSAYVCRAELEAALSPSPKSSA